MVAVMDLLQELDLNTVLLRFQVLRTQEEAVGRLDLMEEMFQPLLEVQALPLFETQGRQRHELCAY